MLSKLPNIGKELEHQLNEIGIYNEDSLKQMGSQRAWLMIKKIDTSACYNRLLALEGAIRNVRKTDLSDEDKRKLKDFYLSHK
ncbi:MAG: TfoX/Sxy family protein [Bacilli bacterium]|nr:TfoX/Sxy family protein [Bacilli bacterium]